MGNVKSGIVGTSRNEFNIGDGIDGYKYIYANTSADPNPGIRYNPDALMWEFSNDATIYDPFFVLGDITIPGDSDKTISLGSDAGDGYLPGDGYLLSIIGAEGINSGSGGDLALRAGDADSGGDGYGGSLLLAPGENSGDGYNGNIFLQDYPSNSQCDNMGNGIYISEVVSAPDGYDDTGGVGGYLYSIDGAIIWKSGASGTETTMGPGCPHCPRCGRDFATSWSNSGEVLSICMWCLTEALVKSGIDENEFIIKKI